MKRRVLYIILVVASAISFSCKDYITVEPQGFIPRDQTFKTADDAITAVYGLYSLMQPCVDQLFLAGDVQADLVVAARGADSWVAEIAQNRITPMNPYTDYSNFYKLVCACNNTIKGLQEIQRLDPLNYSLDRYNYNIAEITAIRAWGYLQLVKIWGDVPYVENTVTNADEITDIPVTEGNVILAKIEKEVCDKSYALFVSAMSPSGMSNLFYTQFNNRTVPFLIAELNLYLGNYPKVWNYVYKFVFTDHNYNCKGATINNWIQQFSYGGSGFSSCIALTILFDGSKGQKNNLMRWTSNINGGIYAVKPASPIIKNWVSQPLWLSGSYDNNGTRLINGYGDPRGIGASYIVSNNDTIISKFLLKSKNTFKNPAQNDPETNNDMNFAIYRDGTLFLDICEAWNAMGMTYEALMPLNGMSSSWKTFGGVRERAGVVNIDLFPSTTPDPYKSMEKLVLNERALESAFEGHRWFDLIRYAKRNNDPSILADAVASKYPAGQQAAIKIRLMSNRNYWYWPYYYKNVAANKLLVQKEGY